MMKILSHFCLFLIPGFLNLVDYPKMPENYRDFVEFKAIMDFMINLIQVY